MPAEPFTPIEDVSDTAFWIAAGRATETERPDALFRDPFAARLIEGRGRDIASRMKDGGGMAWSVALRTVIIDDFIRRAVAGGVDTVVNLGAGLDARPYRLELPGALRWIEADYPKVIAYKDERLRGETPRCALVREGVDLAADGDRRTFLDRALAPSRRALVLTEGVVPYLTVTQTGVLADDLLARPAVDGWILDRHSPLFLKMTAKAAFRRQLRHAPFLFEPDDWEAFFRSHGWALREMRWFGPESRRLKRRPPVRWWMIPFFALMPKAKQKAFAEMVGYALLERTPAQVAG